MRNKTVIVAGLSPWDLGKGIYSQFTDRTEFKRQLSQQLYNYYTTGQERRPCPHPRCWDDENCQFTKDALVLHLYDIHGSLDIGHSHAPYETNSDFVDNTDAADQTSSVEWSGFETTVDLEVQSDRIGTNLHRDESKSPVALPSSNEDAVHLGDSRSDVDTMLHPDTEIFTSDSCDWNRSSEKPPMNPLSMAQNTNFIEGGVLTYPFSMDFMPLEPWNADLEDAAISLENRILSQPAGMITSQDPLLISQNTYCAKTGSLMSPKSDASGLSASTLVDANNGLEPHIEETSTSASTSSDGEYATYTHGLHSMSHVSSLGFQDLMETSLLSQGSESGLVDEPQYETIAIDPPLDNVRFGRDSQWDTFHAANQQTPSIPLSMDGMLVGPWTN